MGKNPSGPSRPPYLTGAASPGRHYGAAGPVRLLRRRHLPAPGPRPRRQPRPIPDGASAIARDFTLCPTCRPPYPARALQPRLSEAASGYGRANQATVTPPPSRCNLSIFTWWALRAPSAPDFFGQYVCFPQLPFFLSSPPNNPASSS